MSKIVETLQRHRLVPVIVLDDAAHADPLADALVEGGLPVAEVTFRTAAAAESIKRMAAVKELLVGAGTVLTIDQVKKAVDNGAQFIVSPGTNPKVVRYCVENSIPITPGVCNPSDIEAALDCGVDVLKFFPAGAMGGLNTLKAISAPYNMVRFIPTGGITEENLCDYLAFKSVIACGGTWMVEKALINAGRFDEIATRVRAAVARAQSA
jgi:2-dehydro-3-deoxyphosphogluconate aldolase/(4S)-4-hydroxy-2-oxoglutarate aldolase